MNKELVVKFLRDLISNQISKGDYYFGMNDAAKILDKLIEAKLVVLEEPDFEDEWINGTIR